VTMRPVADPTSALTEPTSSHEGYMNTVRAKCGIVAGGIDGAIHAITGFSPLQEWVFTPLAGDWVNLDKGAGAWANAGKAAEAIKANLNAGPGQVGDGWLGESFDAFKAAQDQAVTALDELPEACRQMSEMTTAISEAARAVADLIAAVIDEVVEFALEMLASLAIPVAGEIAMPGWIIKLAAKVARWSTKIAKAITGFGRLVVKVLEVVAKMARVAQKVARMIRSFEGLDAEIKAVKLTARVAKLVPDVIAAEGALGDAQDKLDEPLAVSTAGGGTAGGGGGGW